MRSAPARANGSTKRSGSTIIRCRSSGNVVDRRSAFTTSGPTVRFGTNWPSITSTWIMSAPATSTAFTSSPSLEKSAARIDGAIRRGRCIEGGTYINDGASHRSRKATAAFATAQSCVWTGTVVPVSSQTLPDELQGGLRALEDRAVVERIAPEAVADHVHVGQRRRALVRDVERAAAAVGPVRLQVQVADGAEVLGDLDGRVLILAAISWLPTMWMPVPSRIWIASLCVGPPPWLGSDAKYAWSWMYEHSSVVFEPAFSPSTPPWMFRRRPTKLVAPDPVDRRRRRRPPRPRRPRSGCCVPESMRMTPVFWSYGVA